MKKSFLMVSMLAFIFPLCACAQTQTYIKKDIVSFPVRANNEDLSNPESDKAKYFDSRSIFNSLEIDSTGNILLLFNIVPIKAQEYYLENGEYKTDGWYEINYTKRFIRIY